MTTPEGIIALNARDTALGTCSGILITQPLRVINIKSSVDTIAIINPAKIAVELNDVHDTIPHISFADCGKKIK